MKKLEMNSPFPYQDDIRRYAARMTGNWTDADDVVQETALRFLKSPPALEGNALRSFLYRIARNYMLDLFRRRKLAKITRDADGNAVLPALTDSVLADPARLAEQNEDVRRMGRLIQNLPPQAREVLRLRYFENMKTRDIAEITGLSYGYVRKLLCGTVGRLTEQMGENQNG